MSHYVSGVAYNPPRQYRPLTADAVQLEVRQHPQYAVVTPETKEKMRRPVDPPPIVQLRVYQTHDPAKEFLVNPFLFMTATLLEAEEQENGTYKRAEGPQIIGQNVSSLHRLKDIDNRDGGFFVFGDISCRNMGTYRLQFNLFDFDKNNNQVAFVSSIVSLEFKVVSQKEFKGLSESTHLSRTFSDQGVRLRLRKEPRTITGTKRAFDHASQEVAPLMPGSMLGGPVHDRYGGQHYGYETPLQKRARSGSDHTPYGSASSHHSATGMSQYPFPNPGTNWPSQSQQQSQQKFQPDQSPYESLAPHHQPHMGPNSNFQRYVQSDAYNAVSAEPGQFRAYSSMSRRQPAQEYGNPSQGYNLHATHDSYTSMANLPTTTSMPNSGLNAGHNRNYHGPMSQIGGSNAALGSGMLQSQHSQNNQDTHQNSSHYGTQTLPMHPSTQSYQTDAFSDSIHVPSSQPEMKYGQNSYPAPGNMSNRNMSNRNMSNMYANAPAVGALTDTSLPLESGMLNRSYAPSQASLQQSVYDDGNGQDITSFKQEPNSYPTPNQASPLV